VSRSANVAANVLMAARYPLFREFITLEAGWRLYFHRIEAEIEQIEAQIEQLRRPI